MKGIKRKYQIVSMQFVIYFTSHKISKEIFIFFDVIISQKKKIQFIINSSMLDMMNFINLNRKLAIPSVWVEFMWKTYEKFIDQL